MKLPFSFQFLLWFLLSLVPMIGYAQPKPTASFHEKFIYHMSQTYGFDFQELNVLFDQAKVSQSILDAISRPAEQLAWHRYREIFMQESRIATGVDFWRSNQQALTRATRQFGVPAEIIVAIIGVETNYARNTGKYRVIDSLYTLAFHYPKRANFFASELEQFLLLTREQGMSPLAISGSYAGAMGIPQFISSSYRNYAIDFNNDNRVDIWNDKDDAIGSVANYFSEHAWVPGAPIAQKVETVGTRYRDALTSGLKPDLLASELQSYGIVAEKGLGDSGERFKLLELEHKDRYEYWLAHHNFYVITRYNHSTLYAMVVYQLAQEIRARRNKALRQ